MGNNGNPTMEEFVAMRGRKDSYAEANIKLLNETLELRNQIALQDRDLQRLAAQLESANATMQVVVDDNNTRYRAANDEVERLRGLLKQHGIPIGG